MMLFKRLDEIREAVRDARETAEREARRGGGAIRSRGVMLCTATASGESCKPCPTGEGLTWSGTLRGIRELIERVQRDYPEVDSIALYGGFDGAETLKELLAGCDYDPWISEWQVVVWKRDQPTANQSMSEDRSLPDPGR